MMTDRYEAILQLRPFHEQMLEYVYNQAKKTERADITKEVILKKEAGIDLYISSWRFAVALAKKMKKVFHCRDLKITRKLHTFNRQKSKKVYRVTVLLKK